MNLPRDYSAMAIAQNGLAVACSPTNGRLTLRARDPRSLRLRTMKSDPVLLAKSSGIESLAFSFDGTRLASGDVDGNTILWDVANDRAKIAEFQHGSGRLSGLAVARDGRTVILAGVHGARTWDVHGDTGERLLGSGRAVTALAVAEGGGRVFTGTVDGLLEGWDFPGGQRIWFDFLDAPVATIAVSSDSSAVAAGSATGLVKVWGADTLRSLAELTLPASVLDLRFSPDGRVLLAQTPAWLHRFDLSNEPLRVLASRMLPASVPPAGFHILDDEGRRTLLFGGTCGEALAVLDFDQPDPPRELWDASLQTWQQRLKLNFGNDGVLIRDLVSQ